MKNAKIRKVLFTLSMGTVMSLVLSGKGYAATKMLDELVVMNNSNVTNVLGEEGVASVGIYQTALNAYMDTSRTMDTTIANTRTRYGAGETLKIRFSFSKAISSVADLRLGIKFGTGSERVVTADKEKNVDGSYLTFSYPIAKDDNGGLQITFINGSVTDENGKSIALGILGKENTWTNTIVAKGSWAEYESTKEETKSEQLIMPAGDPAYILDGSQIRPIKESDIKILKTNANGITTMVDATSGLSKDGNGVTSVTISPGNEIYIPNACDIAGNVRTITNITGEKWYVLSCDGEQVGDNYYCKAGKIIQFLRINGNNTTITIGDSSNSRNLIAGDVLADKVQKFSYSIVDGDNGQVTTASGDVKIIADTTAPTLNFASISLHNTGIAYYSSTEDGLDNTNGTILKTDESQMSGTIWANKNATFQVNFIKNDQYSYFSTDSLESEIVGYDNEEGFDNTIKTISDWAGNETSINLKNCAVKLIWDTTLPAVNVSSEETSSKNDQIEFSIKLTDASSYSKGTDENGQAIDVLNYHGSGVQFANGYKFVPVSSVNVTNGKIIKSSTSGNTLNITVMPDGDGYVSVYVPAGVTTDNVENKNSESNIAKVRSDRTAPVIHDVTGVPTDWANDATLSVIASDAGIGGIQYSFNGGDYQESNKCTVLSNGQVTVKVKDSLGNESEAKTVNITKIDSSNPTITGIDYHQGWTNQDVEVTIKATDEHSGVKEYSFDGGTTWQTSPKKNYSSTSTIAANQIKVRDFMGKEATYGSAVQIQIDRTAPTIDSVVVSPEELTKDNVILTVNAGDQGGSGLAGYSFNGAAYSTTNTYTVSKNGDITIKVKDNAGNETSIVKTINNIIEPAISFDTTTEGTCIREVKTIDNVNYVIVPEGTTAENLLKYIISPYGLTIKKADNTDVAGDSRVATSYIINANIPCRIVVKGDVTGDGEVDLGDILRLNEYRLDSKKELTTAEFMAGNMIDTDDEINMSDILALNEYRLNR